jgi:hypothetical protein
MSKWFISHNFLKKEVLTEVFKTWLWENIKLTLVLVKNGHALENINTKQTMWTISTHHDYLSLWMH